MTLHEVLNDEARCIQHVQRYYREDFEFGLPRTGVEFDSWAGGGDDPEVANRFTADDFVAVSFLSVNVPPAAAMSLLRDKSGDVQRLLTKIPVELRIEDLTTDDQYEEYLGEKSAAHKLWDIITRKGDEKWGISQTKASKMLARKRPNLIPIVDSDIRKLVGSGRYWHDWHAALTDGSGLKERLEDVKAASGITQRGYDPETLRLMDVILWMEANAEKRQRRELAAVAVATAPPA